MIEAGCITEEIHAAYKVSFVGKLCFLRKSTSTEQLILHVAQETDSNSVLAEDTAPKDLIEQILEGSFEAESNETSKSESNVLVSDTTQAEQISTPEEEMKEVKNTEMEIQEANASCKKIDPEVPEINLREAQQDQKPREQSNNELKKGPQQTTATETRLEGEQYIEKDKQTEDKVPAANEATEDIAHEEDEVWRTPAESPEKDSRRGYAESPSTVEKISDLDLETDTTVDVLSQKSEITEQVEFETQVKETAATETRPVIGQCIEKDKHIEDAVSTANKPTEDTTHEEHEDQSTPVEAIKLEPPDNETRTEYTIEKSSVLTLEIETTTNLMSQGSEITEQVVFVIQTKEKLSLVEEGTVENDKDDKNAVGVDDIPKEKVKKKIRKIC